MILDHEQELTADGGQLFNPADGADEYGSKPYDLMGTSPGDPAVGEALDVFAKVMGVDCDVGTNYVVAVVNDTDGAGGSEVVVATDTIVVANLTANTKHPIGRVMPGKCSMRYLTAKVTGNGAQATAGKLKIFLQKDNDGYPVNAAS